MAYVAWSVVFGEQPTAAKWNILGTNDASFNDGTGFASGAIGSVHASLANGITVQTVNTQTGTLATGTTLIPFDNTTPQNTEGTEFMTRSITPKSATNILIIDVVAQLGLPGVVQNIGGAIFQDSTANALATGNIGNVVTASASGQMLIRHKMVAGTTSATTFKFRAGPQVSGTLTFNGISGGAFFNGTYASSMTITEYKA